MFTKKQSLTYLIYISSYCVPINSRNNEHVSKSGPTPKLTNLD